MGNYLNLIETENEHKLNIKMKEFIKAVKISPNTFDLNFLVDEIRFDNIQEETYKITDKYLFYIIEEIAEFIDALEKNELELIEEGKTNEELRNLPNDFSYNKDVMLEAVDVMLMLGSLVSLYKEKFGFIIQDEVSIDIDLNIGRDLSSLKTYYYILLKEIIFNIRRKFPNRKWHKFSNKENMNFNEFRIFLENVLTEILNSFAKSCYLLLIVGNKNIDDIERNINYKFKKAKKIIEEYKINKESDDFL